MPKRIPIKAARDVAHLYGGRQVIMFVWDGERTHAISYGKTLNDSAQAASGCNKLKDALGWDASTHAESSRVCALLQEIEDLKRTVANLEDMIDNIYLDQAGEDS